MSDRKMMTLTRFLIEHKGSHSKETMNEIVDIMAAIQVAVKVISKSVNTAGVDGKYTASAIGAGMVRKLDVLANESLIDALAKSQQVYVMASEESRDPIILRDDPGGYAVVFDPLDGSQNIDCNCSLGSIFGIYKKCDNASGQTSEKNLLRKGTDLIASGYAHYGAATMLVVSVGAGVHGFLLDPSIGEFLLVRKRISIPRTAPIYSCNESQSRMWDPTMQKFLEYLKAPPKSTNRKQLKSRYVGTMVADVHRSLLYGGLYLYPATSQIKAGKVRLLYECNPIAFLIEQAGGMAFTLDSQGKPGRVLDVQPEALHQRIPFFCGSYDDMATLEKMYKTGGNLPSKM